MSERREVPNIPQCLASMTLGQNVEHHGESMQPDIIVHSIAWVSFLWDDESAIGNHRLCGVANFSANSERSICNTHSSKHGFRGHVRCYGALSNASTDVAN